MPQIMEPNTRQLGLLQNRPPDPREPLDCTIAATGGEYPPPAPPPRLEPLSEQMPGSGAPRDILPSGLAVRQPQEARFQVHIAPLQRRDLGSPAAREQKQPQGGDGRAVAPLPLDR